ncbi:hypothetical protein ABH944_004874 [Caballeronia udeis]|uniref:Lipoprotein n=1 Tax=Caballeronia udeis TaxID=1232866 RepID=A0ABW8MLR6_9BURK
MKTITGIMLCVILSACGGGGDPSQPAPGAAVVKQTIGPQLRPCEATGPDAPPCPSTAIVAAVIH